LFSPRAPWFPPRPKVKLFRSLSYLATSNIQFAQRAGRHTKKRASSPGRYPGGKQKDVENPWLSCEFLEK
jgi:hypothetical protein